MNKRIKMLCQFTEFIYRVTQKSKPVSRFKNHHLIVLKSASKIFPTIFEYKISTKYNKLVFNIIFDLICDIISYCVWSCGTGKVNAYDKIVIENQKKGENMEIKLMLLKYESVFEFSAS